MIRGKKIILGVTGGIAAYKAISLCSSLTQAGASVRVVLSSSALKFVTPLTFQAISRQPVYTDTFDEQEPEKIAHIDLADHADLVIVAPATANFIAKYALGLGDDMLTTILLATRAKVMLAPAMNGHMYAKEVVQSHIKTLMARNVQMIEPTEGQLACGYVGKGRLAVPEDIHAEITHFFAGSNRLQGKKVLVTAGGTIERIDPVRYITNDSSGKMGFALAETAQKMGASVTLISTVENLPIPAGVNYVKVRSTQQMYDRVMEHMESMDIIIKAAAVADYRPLEVSKQKLKKTHTDDETMVLTLVKNPDILQTLGERKINQFLVGFAAETENLAVHAMDKVKRKNCDLLVANDVSLEGAGFGTDTNIVQIFDQAGLVETWPLMHKLELAAKLFHLIADRIQR